MANWTDVDDDNLAPGAPARSADIIAIRDNISAQAEGATGAPKTQAAALSDELYESGQIGTYAFLFCNRSESYSAGQTRSGNLFYASAGIIASTAGGAAGGTWRCMGYTEGENEEGSIEKQPNTTLWLRIS